LNRATDMSLFAVHSAQCHCSGRKRFRPPRPPPWGQKVKESTRQWTIGQWTMGAMDNGTLGQWNWENRSRGQCTMGQSDLGNWEKRAMGQWDNGQVNHGHVDNGQSHNGRWDNGTIQTMGP
jgi:hypothetical protein